jgi:hypothetical protein
MVFSKGAWAACLPITILFASQVFAQAQPASGKPIPFGRLIVDTQIGSARELGFKPPDLGVGFTIEKPIGPHVELQAFADFSPDKKYITNDGNNFIWGAKGIWFPRWHVGISGEIRRSYLWTSQFNKSGWILKPGVMIRDSFGTMAGRFSVDYVVPRGCVWATECRLPADDIQSNRTQGPELLQEFRVLSLTPKYTVRLGGELAFYHFCDQANPLVIVIRTCHFANTMAVTLRLEFSGKDEWY